MILGLILLALFGILNALLNYWPSFELITTNLTSAFSFFFNLVYAWNGFLPVSETFTCLLYSMPFWSTYIIYRAIMWVINVWRGSNV